MKCSFNLALKISPRKSSMRLQIFCWLLSAVTAVGASCGGGRLYLFWDNNCGGGGAQNPSWILSPMRPDPIKNSNLLGGQGGECHNWANSPGSSKSIQSSSNWGSWDGCCTRKAGTWFQVSVEPQGMGGLTVKVSGLCDVAGGRKGANQIYLWSGTTRTGRPWYTSTQVVAKFEGEEIDGEATVAGVISFLVLLCLISICITLCGLCICYSQKCCCFKRPQQTMPPVFIAPVFAQQAVIVGQPVVQAPVVQAQVVQATVVSNSNAEDNPNLEHN